MALFSGSSARRIGMWNIQQAQDAERRGLELLGTAQTNALASVGKGYDQARSDLGTQYTGAIDRLNPYNEAGLNALGMYQSSLGLGGTEGNAAARSAFQESPGRQYEIERATDQAMRSASAAGVLGSGNTLAAISDRTQNIANQGWGDWQNRLSALGQQGQQAAATQAGLQGQYGSQLAGLGQAQGQNEAGIYTGLAGLGLGNIWNSTNSQTNSLTNASNTARNNVASGLNFGLGLAGTGLNLLGLGVGSGGLGGSNNLFRLGSGTGGLY